MKHVEDFALFGWIKNKRNVPVFPLRWAKVRSRFCTDTRSQLNPMQFGLGKKNSDRIIRLKFMAINNLLLLEKNFWKNPWHRRRGLGRFYFSFSFLLLIFSEGFFSRKVFATGEKNWSKKMFFFAFQQVKKKIKTYIFDLMHAGFFWLTISKILKCHWWENSKKINFKSGSIQIGLVSWKSVSSSTVF